MVVLLATE